MQLEGREARDGWKIIAPEYRAVDMKLAYLGIAHYCLSITTKDALTVVRSSFCPSIFSALSAGPRFNSVTLYFVSKEAQYIEIFLYQT
jgi:hypothetical protein